MMLLLLFPNSLKHYTFKTLKRQRKDNERFYYLLIIYLLQYVYTSIRSQRPNSTKFGNKFPETLAVPEFWRMGCSPPSPHGLYAYAVDLVCVKRYAIILSLFYRLVFRSSCAYPAKVVDTAIPFFLPGKIRI